MTREKWFRYGTAVIMAFLIIYLGTKISFIFTPIVIIVQTLFPPIVISGILYYLLRPIVNLLAKKMPRALAIIVVFFIIGGVVTGLVLLVGPELQKQYNQFVRNLPSYAHNIQQWFQNIIHTDLFRQFQQSDYFSLEKITNYIQENAKQMLQNAGNKFASIAGFLANIVVVLVVVPFALFFMLKDGKQAPAFLKKVLPKKHQKEADNILGDMDEALSAYIQGQLIVSFFIGVEAYIGFLIIGLDYSLVLALVAMVTNVIPFIGPWIGTAPAVVVGLLHSPIQGLLVIVVVIIIQQIDSNFTSPLVMGKKLDIHPLTIIFVLLVAGNFGGILGLIFAVPAYALLKVVVTHMYRYIKLD